MPPSIRLLQGRGAARSLLLLSSALLVFAAPLTASAQIINVQTAFSEVFEEGHKATVDFSADWRTGNLSFLVLGGQASLQHGIANHQLMGSLRGELTLAESIADGRRTFEHLRHRYWFARNWAAETFLQHEFDPQRRFRVRLLAGSGARFLPVQDEKKSLALGLALMGEHNEISLGLHPDSGLRDTFLRLSSYVIARVSLGDTLTLNQTFYVQPRIDDFADLRLLSETGLVIPVSERVALNLSFVATIQSRPPAGVVPLDTRLLTRLSVKL